MKEPLRLLALTLAWSLSLSMPATAALLWEKGEGFRSAPVTLPATGKTGFTMLPPEATGIAFTNRLSDLAAAQNRILENGSGVALGDVDGDGWCDVYFCRIEGPNKLYRNLGGWKFEDITARAGVACEGIFATGAVFADVDGDGDLDLLVTGIGAGARLFLNDGRGRFTESTASGLDRTLGSTSMGLADFDGDGDLDLYVVNYRATTLKDSPPGVIPTARMVDGKIVVTPADRFMALAAKSGGVTTIELGEVDTLYRNIGQGRFEPVSWTGGGFVDENGKALTEPERGWGLSVMFRDFNGDGWPDIYVCNDFIYSPDQLWLNEGGKRFRAAPRSAWRNMSSSAMGIDVADINRDGHDDFFVAEMVSRDHGIRHRQRANAVRLSELNLPASAPDFRPEFLRNTLYLNRGDGTYAEIAPLAGVDASEWSWSALFLDVDLDGYEDLLISNGNLHDVLDADTLKAISAPGREDPATRHLKNLLRFPPLETANLCFRNRGDLTFEETGAAWGFNAAGVSHGMALADLDNDGDGDVVVNNLNRAAGLYRNDSTAPRVTVRLKGRAPNTQGIGARIKVLGGPVVQSQVMVSGGRYLSADEPMRVFAAGHATNALALEVTWPGGARSVVTNARANHFYEILETGAVRSPKSNVPTEPPLFADVSSLLGHEHHDDPFDDFARQGLLSKRLSRLGPGVAWADVDGDGWEDLVIGSGKGGALAVYRNDGRGGFARMTNAVLSRAVGRDQTGVVGMGSLLFVGSANYEDGRTNGGSLRVYDLARGASGESVLGPVASTGPLALADVDGDGDLDLFVGGRVIAGRYPEGALSQWLRNEGGRFVPAQRWEQLGLVSGAVFSDLNGDGWPELIVACEWGPLKIFRNEHGKFSEWDAPVITQNDTLNTLSHLTGFWNGVTTGDFDGDGRLDIIASNWGRNTKYQKFLAQPVRVFWGDFGGAGAVEPIEAYFDSARQKLVPWAGLELMAAALPFVQERFETHRAYSNASVEEILAPRFANARQAQVATLDSMLFLNRGEKFEAHPLPAEAQFAPAFAVCVGDADGDGHEDLFLAQNFFDVEPETARLDAGRGLWLRGDGHGGFQPMPGTESGVMIYGQQRGAAVCDFDADGRLDLAVAQNSGETKLYRNTAARPGLRVRLRGAPGNPAGVGAALWLKSGGTLGPLREIHAGSGYWSQDSSVVVLARPQPASHLWIRWPGGKTTETPLAPGTLEVSVDPAGRMTKIR